MIDIIDTQSDTYSIETLSDNYDEIKIIYVYRNDSMKKAQKKYRENHKEKIAEIQKRYYDKKKNDEEFKKKVSEQKKQYYLKKKVEK